MIATWSSHPVAGVPRIDHRSSRRGTRQLDKKGEIDAGRHHARERGSAQHPVRQLRVQGGPPGGKAPASLFNLREVYEQYEFDIEKNVIRYRKLDSEPWAEMVPTEAEIARAKKYFGDA